jgi:hypothetical protein
MEPMDASMPAELDEGSRPRVPDTPAFQRRPRPPRVRPPLTAAQARALRAMAAAPDATLRGVSWTTARALRSLGLCELGPGRRGRLTGNGHAALDEMGPGVEPAKPEAPAPDPSE